ncbi:hypothetical protein [Paraburkholderia sp. MM5384-R2]|uniref:hypothetical protein n=1 Tax=Paraburkholderia sp. MM5384-R2 TaxID=2723097 RepID=UPI00160D9836|nr:hypothetical protein [Paraburkholderia sp. MM5384-R2]MBB5498686.1 hypothetical protein [Paraburkholderia sp. MM5384-R2]
MSILLVKFHVARFTDRETPPGKALRRVGRSPETARPTRHVPPTPSDEGKVRAFSN